MYNQPIYENCNELKAKFKQKYADVTDDDLKCNNGQKEKMLETLQQKLGVSGKELKEIILKL